MGNYAERPRRAKRALALPDAAKDHDHMAHVTTQARQRALTHYTVRLSERPPAVPVRRLGDILDSLPFSGEYVPRLRVEPLAGGGLPSVQLPR